MDIFYIIVLTIAVTILILLLTYIGIKMNYAAHNGGAYPPTKNNCPDYWTISIDGKICNQPTTTGSRNTYSGNVNAAGVAGVKTNGDIEIDTTAWTSGGKSAICAQKLWANQNGLIWDGVSNYNGC